MKWQKYIIVVMVCCILFALLDIPNPGREQQRLQHQRKAQQHQHTVQLVKKKIQQEHVNNPENTRDMVVWYYKLHELYYNGVPDKYDLTGNKIVGVKPNAGKSISYLIKACQLSQHPLMWLKLASIYQNGMYQFDPNLHIASQIYQFMLYRYPTNPDISIEAREQLEHIHQEMVNMATYKWLNLEYKPKKNTHHDKITKLLNQSQPRTTAQGPGLRHRAVNQIQDVFRAHHQHHNDDELGILLDRDDKQFNDAHNTHNSQVVATVANSLKKLSENTDIRLKPSDTLQQIRQYILSKPDSDRRDDALKSLDSVERNILPVVSVGMKEADALNVVWNRINQHESDQDLKDILYQQLSDMQEHGKSVCATGRLERMVDTLSTFDKNVSIKPTYVIHDEMMNKAAKIRNDNISQYAQMYGDQRKDQLERGTAPDQEEFDQKIKDEITNELKKDYVDTDIMTPEKFDLELGKWIDHI